MSRRERFQGVKIPGSPNTTGAAATFQEIADAMGISKQLVWFYYCNAIRKLRRSGTVERLRDLASAKSRQA